MTPVKYTRQVQVEVTLDVETLAEAFSQMNDDEQAKFFVEVAKHFAKFGGAQADLQAYFIGGHLRNCACSTEDARQLVLTIAHGIHNSEHGRQNERAP